MKTAIDSNRAWFIRNRLADMPHDLAQQLVFSDDMAELEQSAADLRLREVRWKSEQADAAHESVADSIKKHGDDLKRQRQRRQRR
jgi:hypothetical protein